MAPHGRTLAWVFSVAGTLLSTSFAEGAEMKEVQALLRHTRQSTTSDIYVEVFESVRRGTADRMDTVLRRISGD
jgi:site-specific recombinase XerD